MWGMWGWVPWDWDLPPFSTVPYPCLAQFKLLGTCPRPTIGHLYCPVSVRLNCRSGGFRTDFVVLLSSVSDPDPHGSALIWLSWIRIRIRIEIRIQKQGKWHKETNKPDSQQNGLCTYVDMFYDILPTAPWG